MMSSRILARRALERSHLVVVRPKSSQQRTLSTLANTSGKWEKPTTWLLAGALLAAASIGSSRFSNGETATTSLDGLGMINIPLGPTTIGVAEEPTVKSDEKDDSSLVEEPVTGISFPPEFHSRSLLGLGVRKKYHFVNVYAMAVYVNQEDFRGLDQEEYEAALLDPKRNKTIRIIMNRTVSMDQVISALLESVEPRMHGKELHALDHFAKLKQYASLNQGDDIVLTIRDDSVECSCSNGGNSVTPSEVFARAICDVYFGKEAISPTVKASVLAGKDDL